MQDLNYWKQFESTGKIEDYLSYCSCVGRDVGNKGSETASKEDKMRQTGEKPYAGIRMCNRNDIETNAYRGI